MTILPSSAKVALITGAARRVGAQIARTLHAQGLNVVLHYNASSAEANALCLELNALRPQTAVAVAADLSTSNMAEKLVLEAVQSWGRLDVLVNNASRFYKTPVGKITDADWQDLMNSNIRGPLFLCQAAAPFLKTHRGCIINITDIHADKPLRDYMVYCISKTALSMLTKALAKELGPSVRVNGVAPGAVIWPEGENSLSAKEKDKIIGETVLGRVGDAQSIAKAVLYLVSDADYVSGHIINVDGGRSLS